MFENEWGCKQETEANSLKVQKSEADIIKQDNISILKCYREHMNAHRRVFRK